MNRILSTVFVTIGAVLLVWVLVVSLRSGHSVETPAAEAKAVVATTAAGLELLEDVAVGVPTLAPPRPTLLDSPHDAEPGVAYVTVEVELTGTAAQ